MWAITIIPVPRKPPIFRVLYDADLVTNIEENQKESPASTDRLNQMIEKSFLTESGRKVARETLLS